MVESRLQSKQQHETVLAVINTSVLFLERLALLCQPKDCLEGKKYSSCVYAHSMCPSLTFRSRLAAQANYLVSTRAFAP